MSKSVRLSSSAAATGRKKKIPMSASAGARKSHAARVPSDGIRAGFAAALTALASTLGTAGGGPLLRHPSTLLEQPVHVAIERCQRRVYRQSATNRLLPVL